MNVGLLKILNNKTWDFRYDMAQGFANSLKNAMELHIDNDIEKQHGYFLSLKGYQQEGKTVGADFEDKLYVGNIHRIENVLYYKEEELAEDDQIINVVVIDGPITRDGGACSYGSKDHRDQILYANTIPQVVGHLFIINTPGGEASARIDYEQAINDCREKGKVTVAWVDGMCCSAGVNLASRCDRTIVMNGKDEFGCIGTMAAFWAVAHDTVDQDGYRYVELVGTQSPDKNAWYREAAKGEYEKLQADLDRLTQEFHQTVREGRPQVTPEMLTGEVFEAQEVMPALVDEIGDMDRAIDAIFELADGTLKPAREVEVVAEEPKEEHEPEPPVTDTTSEEAHQPQNNTEMKEEEMKAAEAAAAQAAEQEQEAPATEQPATEEAPAEEAPATEETPAEEAPAEEQPTEEAPAEEAPAEEQPAEEESAPAGSASEETPAEEEAPAEEAPAEEAPEAEAVANAEAEIDKIQETLASAEASIAERDKTIAELKEQVSGMEISLKDRAEELGVAFTRIEEKDKAIADALAENEKLQKQVAYLQAEVKELSEKPAPMVDASAGVPEGNATGEAPKAPRQSRIKRGMSYKEIRAAMAE